MIVSVSRRTDIAAFYSTWFMNRIRAGFVKTRNPFNPNQVRDISLLPEDVDCLVFWTRNPAPMFSHLDELFDRGFAFYFQVTITGYPKELEHSTPALAQALNSFKQLSDKLGPHRVIWRYDPILLSNITPIDFHSDMFSQIACALNGYTDQVMISLNDFYAKTERNLKKISGLEYSAEEISPSLLDPFLKQLAQSAHSNGLVLTSCAQDQDWDHLGIAHGKCVNADLIQRLNPCNKKWPKDKNQRKACGCVQSVDIGVYNSCLHGCQYCYATHNNTSAKAAYRRHDPDSTFLIERTAQKS